MRRTLLIADLDPTFEGWVGDADGKMICVAPPGVLEDDRRRQGMRAFVRRSGENCETCKGCELGLSA